MKTKSSKLISLILAFAILAGLGNLPWAYTTMAAETEEPLGASAACEGHTLGTFSGVPACVNENGDLHLCENNFPDDNFRKDIYRLKYQYHLKT